MLDDDYDDYWDQYEDDLSGETSAFSRLATTCFDTATADGTAVQDAWTTSNFWSRQLSSNTVEDPLTNHMSRQLTCMSGCDGESELQTEWMQKSWLRRLDETLPQNGCYTKQIQLLHPSSSCLWRRRKFDSTP